MVTRFSGFLAAALCSGLCSLIPGGAVLAQTAPAAVVQVALSESLPATQGSPALDDVKKAFETRFPGVAVTAVSATPYAGLYEIQLGMDLLYTNAHADYLMQGSLIDSKTRADLTSARLAKLSQVAFSSLPLERAIKQVKGNGARKLAVFEDPHCGYCKQLHKTLTQVDNTTVYTFLYPVLSPDSEVKARDVWCANDRAAAWSDWMLNGKAPPSAQCDTPIQQNLALGKKLMVQGTPTIIFADGSRANGALPLDALNERLDALKQ